MANLPRTSRCSFVREFVYLWTIYYTVSGCEIPRFSHRCTLCLWGVSLGRDAQKIHNFYSKSFMEKGMHVGLEIHWLGEIWALKSFSVELVIHAIVVPRHRWSWNVVRVIISTQVLLSLRSGDLAWSWLVFLLTSACSAHVGSEMSVVDWGWPQLGWLLLAPCVSCFWRTVG